MTSCLDSRVPAMRLERGEECETPKKLSNGSTSPWRDWWGAWVEACGGEEGSSTDTRVPEIMVEDPASGVAVVGMRSQEPATVLMVLGEVSVETVAETTRTVVDISKT